MPAKPMLDDVELQQVQETEAEEHEARSQHGVPALEGDFLQDLGRRATRISLTGVLTGAEAGTGLKKLREKFQAAEPVPYVADIAAATKVDNVLIAEMGIRELAGKPERFEYAIHLIEFAPPPPDESAAAQSVDEGAKTEAAGTQSKLASQAVAGQGAIEVTVDLADLNQLQVQVKGKTDGGQDYTVVLDQQTHGVFRKTDVPAGEYIVTLQIKD